MEQVMFAVVLEDGGWDVAAQPEWLPSLPSACELTRPFPEKRHLC